MLRDVNGQRLNLMTMLVKLVGFGLGRTLIDILMFLVNVVFPTIRCAVSPDNEKVVFTNHEYQQPWPLERAPVCATRPEFTIFLPKPRIWVAPRLARNLLRLYPPRLPRRTLARPTLIDLAWDGHRRPHTRLGLRRARDLRGPNGIWVKH